MEIMLVFRTGNFSQTSDLWLERPTHFHSMHHYFCCPKNKSQNSQWERKCEGWLKGGENVMKLNIQQGVGGCQNVKLYDLALKQALKKVTEGWLKGLYVQGMFKVVEAVTPSLYKSIPFQAAYDINF